MSNINTGSVSGVAGCVGTMEQGQGAREISRLLTRNDYDERVAKAKIDWVIRPIETFKAVATPKPWREISERLSTAWSFPPLEPSEFWN